MSWSRFPATASSDGVQVIAVADGAPPPDFGELGRDGAPEAVEPSEDERAIAIYSAAVRRLITKDHTFGNAKSPFRLLYVEDSTEAWRGRDRGERGEPFSSDVKAGIRQSLTDLSPLEFLSETKADRFTSRFRDSNPDRAVIVTIGPVDGTGDHVEVQVRMYCGGLCGQALTYVVENRNSTWRTAGMTGPLVIA